MVNCEGNHCRDAEGLFRTDRRRDTYQDASLTHLTDLILQAGKAEFISLMHWARDTYQPAPPVYHRGHCGCIQHLLLCIGVCDQATLIHGTAGGHWHIAQAQQALLLLLAVCCNDHLQLLPGTLMDAGCHNGAFWKVLANPEAFGLSRGYDRVISNTKSGASPDSACVR